MVEEAEGSLADAVGELQRVHSLLDSLREIAECVGELDKAIYLMNARLKAIKIALQVS